MIKLPMRQMKTTMNKYKDTLDAQSSMLPYNLIEIPCVLFDTTVPGTYKPGEEKANFYNPIFPETTGFSCLEKITDSHNKTNTYV